jgi:hypothetical protein
MSRILLLALQVINVSNPPVPSGWVATTTSGWL